MFAVFDVAVSKLIDQDDLRMARENAVQIHFFKDDAFVFDSPARDLLQLLGQLRRARPSVRLHDADHDVLAALVTSDRLAEHVIGFADPRRITEKKLEGTASLFGRDLFQPLLRAFRGGI